MFAFSIFKSKWRRLKGSKLTDYIRGLNNDRDISNIAKRTENIEAIVVALEKINDQEILTDIAKNAADYRARMEALKKLTIEDQDNFVSIVRSDPDHRVRKEAILKLDPDRNPLFYLEIALKEDSEWVGKVAVEKINDQESLKDIARNSVNSGIRAAAVMKLNSSHQEVLSEIALNDPNDRVVTEAVRQLDPSKWQQQLAEIAKKRRHGSVGAEATRKLDPVMWQDLLLDLVKNYSTPECQKIALEKLDPQKYGDVIKEKSRELNAAEMHKRGMIMCRHGHHNWVAVEYIATFHSGQQITPYKATDKRVCSRCGKEKTDRDF